MFMRCIVILVLAGSLVVGQAYGGQKPVGSDGLDDGTRADNADLRGDSENEETSGPTWPLRNAAYGDISSVATHPSGELFLLHRGPHRWSERTFNQSNFYQDFESGPIQADVLVGLDEKTGEELHSWGRNRFHLPHGLTIDSKGNFWITDVALHQVMKIDPTTLEITMTLGVAGVPGSDTHHFCKPTDVAVASDGSFFVADGYCNSRIIKFSPQGKYLMQFGQADAASGASAPDALSIPHSLALIESYDLLCVANREDEKIQCFSAGLQPGTTTGQFVLQVAHPSLSRVFAIHYSSALNRLYAVNGMGFSLEDKPSNIFSIDLLNNEVMSWNPAEDGVQLTAPHDLTLSNNGQYIYVADLSTQPTLWKFDNGDFKVKDA